ncbi:MAG: zinc-binding dehydrogenase [Nitrospirota bacterium]
MLANLLIKPGVLKLKEIKTPEPSDGEILVRIKTALTCGTDLKAFKRGHPMMPMPTVFGHEFSGVVEKAGRGVKKFTRGTEIMAVHSAPCEECCFCKKGLYNLCKYIMKTKVLGAFAEYILLPKHIVKQNVFIKPRNLSYAEAAFLEPLSCVIHSINSVYPVGKKTPSGFSNGGHLTKGDTAVIIGAGPIGLLHLMILKTMGIKIIIIEKQKERLKKALELKADIAINPGKKNVIKKIMAYTDNCGADAVFECTGIPEVWESSVWLVRRGGTIVLFGGCKQGTQVKYDTARIHYDEVTLKGVFHFKPSDVAQAYDFLSRKKIKVRKLISGQYPLNKLDMAFKKLAAGKGIKYAIIP